MENFEFKKITEVKDQIESFFSLDRLQELRSAISYYLDRASNTVEHKIDGEKRKALKEAYQILDRARKEIETIQKGILGLLKKPAKKRSVKAGSKVSKKKVALRKKATSSRQARAH
jgi:F0F1-type ATP synthase membrane subunit b/b'